MTCLFCFVAFVSVSANSKVDIDRLLIDIENQRTQGLDQLQSLLVDAANERFKFNDYQRCLYNYLELYHSALSQGYQQSLPQFEQLFDSCDDVRIKVRIKNMEANIRSFMKNYRLAIEALDYSLKHVSELNDKHLLSMTYSSAFIVYSFIEQYPLSLQFSELLMDESDLAHDQCRGKYNRVKIYLLQDDNHVNANDVQQVVDYCLSHNEGIYAYLLLFEYYDYLIHQNNSQQVAERLLEDLEAIKNEVDALEYPYLTEEWFFIQAHLFFVLEDFQAFEAMIPQLKQLDRYLELSENKIDYFGLMVEYHLAKGDKAAAFDYLQLDMEEKEKFYADKEDKQVAYQIVKHETMANQMQNELLKQQNQLLQIKQDLAKENMLNQRLITAVISLLGLLLILWTSRLVRKHQSVKKEAALDYLTGCYNRKTFEQQVNLQLSQLELKDLILHLVIMDLDHFKSVNDQYGHLKGDLVLKKVISYCESQLTDLMLLGRLGGEEFGILIIETNSKEMMNQINDLRIGIEALDFSEIDDDLVITASFGVASSVTSGYQWQTLISHADEALYLAKEQGRNRVVRHELIRH